MNKLRDSGIYEKLAPDSGSKPPLPDPVEWKYEKQQTFIRSQECNNQTRPDGPDGTFHFNAVSLTLEGNESYATLL